MEKFISHSGIVAPIDIPNVDTDAIIPKQFLKSITELVSVTIFLMSGDI